MAERRPDRDEWDRIQRQIEDLQTKVTALQNNARPTVPVYDPGQFPINPIEGQIALGTDELAYKYQNGVWSPLGGFAFTWSRYAATTTTVNRNTTNDLTLNNPPSFGSEVFDRSTPARPVFLLSGNYQISCNFRLVLAFGNPTLGSAWQGIISGVGKNYKGFFTVPDFFTGSWLPEITVITDILPITAGTEINFAVHNADASNDLIFDSPDIRVTKFA